MKAFRETGQRILRGSSHHRTIELDSRSLWWSPLSGFSQKLTVPDPILPRKNKIRRRLIKEPVWIDLRISGNHEVYPHPQRSKLLGIDCSSILGFDVSILRCKSSPRHCQDQRGLHIGCVIKTRVKQKNRRREIGYLVIACEHSSR